MKLFQAVEEGHRKIDGGANFFEVVGSCEGIHLTYKVGGVGANEDFGGRGADAGVVDDEEGEKRKGVVGGAGGVGSDCAEVGVGTGGGRLAEESWLPGPGASGGVWRVHDLRIEAVVISIQLTKDFWLSPSPQLAQRVISSQYCIVIRSAQIGREDAGEASVPLPVVSQGRRRENMCPARWCP